MKVFMCVTIAQEIDGKNLLVRFDKCSKTKQAVDNFIAQNKASWVEKIPVGQANLDFACERHPYEIEVED